MNVSRNMVARIIGLFLFASGVASAMTYELIPLDRRWPAVDIIAIVEVGDIHRVTTPEGVTLESAVATIERLIYRRNDPFDPDNKTTIRIYKLLPNGVHRGMYSLSKGRAFVMMKMQGMDAFYPTDPWEFQPITSEEIRWRTKEGIKNKTIDEVAQEVKAHIDSRKNDKGR